MMRTGDNKTVIIPNGNITGGVITNYSTKPTRRIDLIIGVGYDADLIQTKTILNQVISKDSRILPDQPLLLA